MIEINIKFKNKTQAKLFLTFLKELVDYYLSYYFTVNSDGMEVLKSVMAQVEPQILENLNDTDITPNNA